MRPRRPPRIAVALLNRVACGNEPLAGDLLEAWRERSNAWLWRQVLLAIVTLTIARVRANPRLAIEQSLVASAMVVLLGFSAVVVASLVTRLIVMTQATWIAEGGRYGAWQLLATSAWFAAAMAIGCGVRRIHRDHRVAAVLAFGGSASAAAFLNLYLFVPGAHARPFVADGALPIAAAALFVGGLFVGMGSRSRCERLPHSGLGVY